MNYKFVYVILTIVFFSLPNYLFGQLNYPFFFNKEVAYNKFDSSLYTGNYDELYRNGNIKYYNEFEKGLIKLHKYWDKKGNLIDSIIFIDGYKQYFEYRFYKNGFLKSSGVYQFNKTIEDEVKTHTPKALHTTYYKNGNRKFENFYYEDRTHRRTTYYNEYGIIQYSGVYIDSSIRSKGFSQIIEDSLHYVYNKNGFLQAEKSYVNGKKHGKWIFYNENFNIKVIKIYKDGKLIKQ